MAKQPHLIIFNPDQWRGDVVGHVGNPAAVTPTLDAVVKDDFVSFANTYCQNPVCTPSRCSFMSGWYPHVRGHRTMHHMLHPERGETNLLRELKNNGYHVWWGGKNDLVPAQDGFDEHCTIKYQPPEEVHQMYGPLDRSWRGEPGSDTWFSFYVGELENTPPYDHYHDRDWANVYGAVEQIKNAPADKPLCIYLPLTYPHPPYGVERSFVEMIDRGKLPPRVKAPEDWTGKPSLLKGIWERQNLAGWTEDRWDALRAVYYGMCSRVDAQFALVLGALREAGIYDDSAVFLFSDHGDFTGDYGLVEKTQNTFEDCLTRVPFLFKPPATHPVKARVSDALVELIDFTATAYELAGIEPPYTQFGKSLLPLAAGETDELRDAVFCEGGRQPDEMHCREGSSFNKNAEKGLYWPRLDLQMNHPIAHSRAFMCRTKTVKYVSRCGESDELYDLQADPTEEHNRIGDPAMADVKAAMQGRLLEWFTRTCDVVPFEIDRRS